MKFSTLNLKSRQGFTLIELLVVIAIIGILASTVLASVSSARGSARDIRRLTEAKQLQTALELHRNSHSGLYPCAANANPDSGNCSISGNSSGGLGNGVSTFGNSVSPNDTTLLNTLNFHPTTDPTYDLGFRYRVSTGSNRAAYTILVRLETKKFPMTGGPNNPYCSINMNTSATWATYPPCF